MPARFIRWYSCSLLSLALICPAEEVQVSAPFAMPAIPVAAFPARDFRITDFGAVKGDCDATTEAVRRAIEECSAAGGGRVVVPAGRWLIGKVHLRSQVNLHLEEGAVLEFSDEPARYLPAVKTSWEGIECYNYSPLIYADGCENIALTGPGTVEARMGTWKEWAGRPPAHLEALKRLYHFMSKDVSVEERQMAEGENHLRPHFIQINRSRRVLIEDLKVRNSPFWVVHLFGCEDVIARRVNISARGHNNDGIDPEMSRNVLVEDCVFDQGDDAIAIKAGRNRDGWRLNQPTENVVIRRCTMLRGHQLVAIGSEVSGGIRNVYVTDCQFLNEVGDPPQHILFIKTNRRRGGFIENIFVERIRAKSTRVGAFGVETDVLYQWRDLVPTYEERLTRISGLHFRDIEIDETPVAFRILGDPLQPVTRVRIENVRIGRVTEKREDFRQVEDLEIRGVQVGNLN